MFEASKRLMLVSHAHNVNPTLEDRRPSPWDVSLTASYSFIQAATVPTRKRKIPNDIRAIAVISWPVIDTPNDANDKASPSSLMHLYIRFVLSLSCVRSSFSSKRLLLNLNPHAAHFKDKYDGNSLHSRHGFGVIQKLTFLGLDPCIFNLCINSRQPYLWEKPSRLIRQRAACRPKTAAESDSCSATHRVCLARSYTTSRYPTPVSVMI